MADARPLSMVPPFVREEDLRRSIEDTGGEAKPAKRKARTVRASRQTKPRGQGLTTALRARQAHLQSVLRCCEMFTGLLH